MFIKSPKALDYLKMFDIQCPRLSSPIEDDVAIWMKIFYKTRRPDLDDSLILDAMQDRIYLNDRQVKERHIFWALDKDNPRASIAVCKTGQSNPL